jgi:hypothetical protein
MVWRAKPAKPKGPASTFNFNQYGPSPYDDVVLRWDEETLTAVRATKPPPTVVARSLAVVHTAMYDEDGWVRGWRGSSCSVSSPSPSNRACGSPAHGSPTSLHRRCSTGARQGRFGLGATTVPLREISPRLLGER